MVNLNADVARRVAAFYFIDLNALGVGEGGSRAFVSTDREVSGAFCQFCDKVQPFLEKLVSSFHGKIIVNAQGGRLKGRDEDRLRRVGGIGDDVVRFLFDKGLTY